MVQSKKSTSPASFDEAAQQLATEIAQLLVKKQRAYGPKNILNCPAGVEVGLIVRLHDKLARIANLTAAGINPDWETVEDTWNDIQGYGMIGTMIQRGWFTLPLEEK